jgi:hypothetical protein
VCLLIQVAADSHATDEAQVEGLVQQIPAECVPAVTYDTSLQQAGGAVVDAFAASTRVSAPRESLNTTVAAGSERDCCQC